MKKSILRATGLAAIAALLCVECDDGEAERSSQWNGYVDEFLGIVSERQYTLTITASPAEGGYVSRSPDQPTYTPWTTVTLTATPKSGYMFTGWSVASTSADARITIWMGGNKTLIANFREYKTVVIGGKTWMAENLNYEKDSSWCYSYSSSDANCRKYGRLYDWNTAMTVCPSGWHLPSREEWDQLAESVGGTMDCEECSHSWSNVGNKLKAKSDWYNNGNGTDNYGFSALPGGYRTYERFYAANYSGYWWTATEDDTYVAYARSMNYSNDDLLESHDNKSYGFSVRCIQN